jgi:hypothetical protein
MKKRENTEGSISWQRLFDKVSIDLLKQDLWLLTLPFSFYPPLFFEKTIFAAQSN